MAYTRSEDVKRKIDCLSESDKAECAHALAERRTKKAKKHDTSAEDEIIQRLLEKAKVLD